MRINPFGSFKDVQRLIELPSKAGPEGAREFSSLLSQISPEAKSIQQHSTTPETPKGIDLGDARASIDLPPPALLRPDLDRVMPRAELPSVDAQPAPSVKVPTLVSARRVSLPDPFQGMSEFQRQSAVANLVRAAGARHGVDPALSMAVVATESSFDPRAHSSDGHDSKGLMQLLDATGQEELNADGQGSEYEPLHPHLNVDLGVRYLRKLHDMFSATTAIGPTLSTSPAANSASLEKLAVAAFNAGQGRVASAQQRAERAGKNSSEYEQVEAYLPQSTQEYVRRVLSKREEFEVRFER